MKKRSLIISGITAALMIFQTAAVVYADENTANKWNGTELDINNPTGPWAPYKFVYELLNEVTELMRNNHDIDIRVASDKLDLENPENSKVAVKVGSEQAKQQLEECITEKGYSKDLLEITVAPNFLPMPDILINIFGDVDLNGSIDVTDLTGLSLALLGDSELTEEQKSAADVDGDGAVTLADLARLQQYLSKKVDSLR
ncbi:MAG: dockerin type I repeat-containing protein [Oscillospiraceae bacterium]|nr:dockerin type I repeat-containing protein [Oscillospiraceae bacterium]